MGVDTGPLQPEIKNTCHMTQLNNILAMIKIMALKQCAHFDSVTTVLAAVS